MVALKEEVLRARVGSSVRALLSRQRSEDTHLQSEVGGVHFEASILAARAAVLCAELARAVEAVERGKEGRRLCEVRLRVERVWLVLLVACEDERVAEGAQERDEVVGGDWVRGDSGGDHGSWLWWQRSL